jgi:hypothetical protein
VVRERRVIVGYNKGGDVDMGRLEFEGQRIQEVGRRRNVVCMLCSRDA